MVRLSAADRREQIIQAALVEFGEGGFVSTSTEAIAERVGISQAYLFKVFGTKRQLQLATIDRNSALICETFTRAADEQGGPGPQLDLHLLGASYSRLVADVPGSAGLMVHGHAMAVVDAEIAAAVRAGNLRVLRHLRALTGLSHMETLRYYGVGVLVGMFAMSGIDNTLDDESLSMPELYVQPEDSTSD